MLSSYGAIAANAIPSVWTEHNDNARTGQNVSETVLTPANVNVSTFGALFHYTLDDQSYSQPLYIPGLTMSVDGQSHNVVFVTTVNNSVYAFDADSGTANGGNPLWHVSLTMNGGRPPDRSDFAAMGACNSNYADFAGHMGIVGTPVIDTSTNTLYVVARTIEAGAYIQRLHALDCKSGAEKFAGPVVLSGSFAGTNFDPALNNPRTALALANGVVYGGWSSQCDFGGYHGYMLGYNATNLSRVAAWSATNSSGGQAGIWQGGQAPAVDSSNNLYIMTGNGTFDGAGNFGESFVKLAGGSLTEQDFFTPNNFANLNQFDTDLGSAGALLIPGTTDVVGGGKQGMVYLLNTANMGHENGTDQVIQEFQATFPSAGNTGHIHGGPIYYAPNNRYVYLWGENDFLRAYQFNGTTFNSNAVAASTMRAPVSNSGMPGGFLSLSANGTTNGIVWALTPYNANANNATVAGILHAFDAQNFSGGTLTELWNSQQNAARDNFGNYAKFTYPTVVNGKVYVPTFGNASSGQGALWIYGNLSGGTTGPVQIDCGGGATGTWVADTDFNAGTPFSSTATIDTSAVTNPAPQAVYQTVRWAPSMTYTIPGLTAGSNYTVRLHFAELSWTAAGQRKFNVAINGTTVLSAFDIFAAAGAMNKANIQQFTATANASGQIAIAFTNGGVDNPECCGIEVSAAAGNVAPSAPTLSGSAGNAQTTLTWTTSTGTPTPTYTVLRGTSPGTETSIQANATSPFNNTGLTNGQAYYYKVQAINVAGTATSNEVGPLTPQPSLPGTPTLSGSAGNAQVTLNWTSASGASTYNVYQNGTLKTTGLTGLTTNVTGLTNGTTYNFTVAAVNSAGTGAQSNSVPLTPNVSLPGGTTLSGSAGNAQVTLNWTASSNATSYNIYQNGTLKSNTGNTGLSANVTGLTNGTTYNFTVAGVNSAGTGSQSNSVPLTPAAASNMVIGIACGNSAQSPYVADVDFSGGAVSSGTTTTISTTGVTNPAPQSVYQHARKGTCTYTIPGLTAGGSYTVRLHFAEYAHTGTGQRTFNVSINGTQVLTNFDIFAAAGGEFKANVQQFAATANGSGQIVLVFTTVLDNVLINGIEIDGAGGGNTAPSAPTLTATPGNASVALSWTTSTGTPAPTYTVMRGTSSGNETTTLASNQTGTTFNDTGLTNGTQYFYIVKAINSVGTATSAEKSATPSGGVTGIDLIVTSVSWTPTTLASGTHMVFSCVVKNQGSVATPAGTVIGVQFAVDGVTTPINWSDTDSTSLGAGQSVTLTANNGTNAVNYWPAVSGSHTVQAWVDDVNRIAESNETNNKTTAPFTVP